MSVELVISLIAFAFVTSITPGPNNLMLMASGANFGFRRTVPHMLGVALGFTFMVVLVGVGLVQVFDAYPVTYDVLKVVSIAYLLFLAWKIATAAGPGDAGETGTPFTFVQAALFQWVNPKAWTMALASISLYAPSQTLAAIGAVALVFGAVNLPSVSVWVMIGRQLRLLLTNPLRLRTFNIVMAILLVASLAAVI